MLQIFYVRLCQHVFTSLVGISSIHSQATVGHYYMVSVDFVSLSTSIINICLSNVCHSFTCTSLMHHFIGILIIYDFAAF